MSRESDITLYTARKAAASAGTATVYVPTDGRPFIFTGFNWLYESAEANVNNTLDFAISYSTDGFAAEDVALFTNGNAVGLLDTSAPLVVNDKKGNAASAGGAAVDASGSVPEIGVRVPAGAVLKFVITTAGTGTVPAVQLTAYGVHA